MPNIYLAERILGNTMLVKRLSEMYLTRVDLWNTTL